MKNKLVIFSCLAITTSAFAQGIGDITVEPQSANSNQPIRIVIKSAGDTPACGLEVNFGDGTVRQVRGDTFPVTVEHTYQKDGNYAVSVTGRGMTRGLKSLIACSGNKSLALQVGGGGASAGAGTTASPSRQNPPQTAQLDQLLKGMQQQMNQMTQGASPAGQQQPNNPSTTSEKQREQERLAEEQRQRTEESRLAEEKRQRDAQQKAQIAAREQQMKDLNEKGVKFAKESTTKWKALQTKDQMTGKVSELARAEVSGPAGSAAIELRCEKDPSDRFQRDNISITFVINNLSVPTTFRKSNEWATGRINANGRVEEMTYLFQKGTVNRFDAAFDTFVGPAPLVGVKNGYLCRKDKFEILGICQDEKVEYVHTLMIGLKTFKGEILAQVPPFDPSIRSIVKDCEGGK